MYKETMDGVKQYEENVRHSRMVFNDTVTKFNRAVRQIQCALLRGQWDLASVVFKTQEGKLKCHLCLK